MDDDDGDANSCDVLDDDDGGDDDGAIPLDEAPFGISSFASKCGS